MSANPRALIAPDKFKGTFSAAEVAAAIADGWPYQAELCPVADGGEGTAHALLDAWGGEWVPADATDPLGRPLAARYALLGDGNRAVVEVAAASGLRLLTDQERDPVGATSRGTGELIADAISKGAETVYVACGGSATTDGGAGLLEAFDPSAAQLIAICDTDVPFECAAEVFAPQKGADEAQVELLAERLQQRADELPRDPRGVPMSGGAGGIAGGLWAHGAELALGAPFVLDALDFDRRLRAADLVITGEGALDLTTLTGKAPAEVAKRAKAQGTPCHAVVGRDALDDRARAKLNFRSVQEAGSLDAISAAVARIDSLRDA